jgi:hypothetical protein
MPRPYRKDYFTVVDVFRDLGFEPVPDDTWQAGAMMRDLYTDYVDEPPALELRSKTNGHGTHCFAVYPPGWREKAEEVVRKVASHQIRQMRLI